VTCDHGRGKDAIHAAVVAVLARMPAYRRRMHPHHRPSPPVPTARACDPGRVRYLHLVAAARAGAVRPASPQQIADIVRVTVDDEVDTTTFRAIVSDVATDILH
jgi:hypothetical protein